MRFACASASLGGEADSRASAARLGTYLPDFGSKVPKLNFWNAFQGIVGGLDKGDEESSPVEGNVTMACGRLHAPATEFSHKARPPSSLVLAILTDDRSEYIV